MTDNSVSFNDEGGVTVDGAPRVLGSRLARRLGLASRVEVDELEASRARIIAAADAQRRRIERDLHDGAQQHLVALAVNLQAGARSSPTPIRTQRRRCSRDRGATSGKRSRACESSRTGSTRRCFSTAASPRLSGPQRLEPVSRHASRRRRRPAIPPDVEATVYFCCLEALQNAAEHAGAGARATVHAWYEQGALHFEVVDDGVGFEQSVTRGVRA